MSLGKFRRQVYVSVAMLLNPGFSSWLLSKVGCVQKFLHFYVQRHCLVSDNKKNGIKVCGDNGSPHTLLGPEPRGPG